MNESKNIGVGGSPPPVISRFGTIKIYIFIINYYSDEKTLCGGVSASLIRRRTSTRGTIHDQGKSFCTMFVETFNYELQFNEH